LLAAELISKSLHGETALWLISSSVFKNKCHHPKIV
jgi:hypothetical protein